jgi:peptide deformylase
MKIITAPHPNLRLKTQAVDKLDKKNQQIITGLRTTLGKKQDPPGVGLAATQVNKKISAFALRLMKSRQASLRQTKNTPIQVIINPKIIDHSAQLVLGADYPFNVSPAKTAKAASEANAKKRKGQQKQEVKKQRQAQSSEAQPPAQPNTEAAQPNAEADLEGCLSIPGIYGPVPRWSWIELEYQLVQDGELVTKTERFTDFTARIIQHEYDHLQGVLFTDHILEYGLPAYVQQGDELRPLDDRSVLRSY